MTLFDRIAATAGDTTTTARLRAERATRRRDGIGPATALGLASLGALAGAAAAFLLDPARGRARRARLVDQGGATLRRTGRHARHAVNRIGSDLAGRVAAVRAQRAPDTRALDDATLTDRVSSIVFRDHSIPKGALNVNVERGVVVLRGEIPDEAMRARLVADVDAVDGVWSVHDLMHLPGEEAVGVRVAS